MALVTAAGQGIGRAIAAKGATLIATDAKVQDLKKAAQRLKLDVCSTATVQALAKKSRGEFRRTRYSS